MRTLPYLCLGVLAVAALGRFDIHAQEPIRITVPAEATVNLEATQYSATISLSAHGATEVEAQTALDEEREKVLKSLTKLNVQAKDVSISAVGSPPSLFRHGAHGLQPRKHQVLRFTLPFDGKEANAGLRVSRAIQAAINTSANFSPNHSAAVAACKTYAEAQDIYRRTDWDADGVLEYSQSIRGANSLYEKTAGTGDLTLVDQAFALAEGKPSGKLQPKAGYCFRVLTGQGPAAPGGRKSYVIGANMVLGYAVLAYPFAYNETGRLCFLINNTGTVYEKDLGPQTAEFAENATEYNPDPSWRVTEGGGLSAPPHVQVAVKYSAPKALGFEKATSKAMEGARQAAEGMAKGLGLKVGRVAAIEVVKEKTPTAADLYASLVKMRDTSEGLEEPVRDDPAVSDSNPIPFTLALRVEYILE